MTPEIFEFEEMGGDVETEGELTRGASIFDRRQQPEWRVNMEVATSINIEAARQLLVDQLMKSGDLSSN